MQIVIDIPQGLKIDFENENWTALTCMEMKDALMNGTPLPKGHGFIAICDSDFPITEEVKQELKNTVFVGNEDCRYCFDITEIIEADLESEDKE